MAEIVYNKVTPEIIEAFKQIVPGKVYVKDEINEDYFHDEMPIYGKGAPVSRLLLKQNMNFCVP